MNDDDKIEIKNKCQLLETVGPKEFIGSNATSIELKKQYDIDD